MSVTEEIRAKLHAAFAPDHLDVVDESEQHRGHAGYQEGGESHFRVTLSLTDTLADLSRIGRHRAVHEALGAELIARIHALAIQFVE